MHTQDDPPDYPVDATLFGVRHTDARLEDIATETATPPVDNVYHEWPESVHSTLKLSGNQLLRHPAGFLTGSLRIICNPSILTEGSTTSSNCRDAAEAIADEYNAGPVENIGMNRIERLQIFPLSVTLVSWMAVFFLFYAVSTAVVSGVFLYAIFQVTLALFGFTGCMQLLKPPVRSVRDEHMASNVAASAERNKYKHVTVVVGENHVEGIATHLQARDIEADSYWVSSTLDKLRS